MKELWIWLPPSCQSLLHWGHLFCNGCSGEKPSHSGRLFSVAAVVCCQLAEFRDNYSCFFLQVLNRIIDVEALQSVMQYATKLHHLLSLSQCATLQQTIKLKKENHGILLPENTFGCFPHPFEGHGLGLNLMEQSEIFNFQQRTAMQNAESYKVVRQQFQFHYL